jgi:NHL repeat
LKGTRRQVLKVLLALVAIAASVSLLGASFASAATVYQNTGGEFEPGSAPPTSLAVDDASGDIVAAGFFSSEIMVYAPEGAGARFLGSFSEPALGAVGTVAIDQATRSLFVSDTTNGRIHKYAISGGGPLTFTPDSSFVSPMQGSGVGEIGSFDFPTTLAVDPTTGDLLVTDNGNQRVSRFAPDGSFVSSFDGADSAHGAFHYLTGIGVAPSGAIYVVDQLDSNSVFHLNEGAVERYTPTGVADNAFSPVVEMPMLVTVDPNSQNVVVVGRANWGSDQHPARIYSLQSSGAVIQESDLPQATAGSLPAGLSVQGGGARRLYVGTRFFQVAGSVSTFEPLLAPDIAILPPSSIGPTSATISGTVNPLGRPTSYHVEYSREGGALQQTPVMPVGEGEAAVDVSEALTGLVANSDYTVRLVASNDLASISTQPQRFRTAVAPPAVRTGGAPNPTASTATVTGFVNPYGLQTSYFFELGPTTTYGSRVPLGREAVAGNGREDLRVAQEVSGLLPQTTYHFRLVAENAAGVSYGDDETFATPAASSARAFELVTPNEKGGSFASNIWVHATPTGDTVTYLMQNVISGLGGAAPKLPRYWSSRSSDAWTTVGLEPHNVQTEAAGTFLGDVLAVSEDGSRAVVTSTADLAAGGTDGGTNLYLLDIAAGSYETILSNPDPLIFGTWSGLNSCGSGAVIDGTPDFSRVYLTNGAAFGLELVEGVAAPSLFEWSEGGGLKVLAENAGASTGQCELPERQISEDGSVVFYQPSGGASINALYGGQDIPLGEGSVEFVGASLDGRTGFYVENGGTLVRFDLETQARAVITTDLAGGSAWGVSDDAETVYFTTSESSPIGIGLWVWHHGELHRITPDEARVAQRLVSSNGRFALFTSASALTGYESGGTPELYRYDADTQVLACASCRTDGDKPLGAPRIGEVLMAFERYKPRSLLNNGEVFFDTPDPLVRSDVNSSRDVYSFDGQNQALISSGTGASDSFFGDASSDGDDVFFVTGDRLVKGDTNDDVDLYDARVGGGIPSQSRDPDGSACSGPGCRGGGSVAPPAAVVGSENGSGQRAVAHRHKSRHAKRCRDRRRRGKPRCVKAHNHKQRRQGR